MFRLICPKCGAEPDEAMLEVVSGTFRASKMWLREDGFATMDAKSFDTDEETVYCHSCERWFPLGDCAEESGPAPSFEPFKGFDWTELAARFGVETPEDDPQVLATWLELRIRDGNELPWVAKTCREFLAALIGADPTDNRSVWEGMARIEKDESFMAFFIRLLAWMWT